MTREMAADPRKPIGVAPGWRKEPRLESQDPDRLGHPSAVPPCGSFAFLDVHFFIRLGVLAPT